MSKIDDPTEGCEAQYRTVKLPLKELERCEECGEGNGLRLCSKCYEVAYCSQECQKINWPSHKSKCSGTDLIDISLFYPLIACLIEASHIHANKPIHPALTHQIINSPNPATANPVRFPDGSAAKLVILGDPIPMQETGSKKWWPTADSPEVRCKLLRRFGREGYVVPILTAACLALLAEMYTTPNSEPEGVNNRTRLKYRSSPIADYGIACGRAEVKNKDRLACLFLHPEELSFSKGQDPDKHYWIYFTTARGEELTLDCSMFTFNFCMIAQAKSYCNVGFGPPGIFDFVPAYFEDRWMKKEVPSLAHESAKFSVLRDRRLQQAVRCSKEGFFSTDVQLVAQFMEDVAGRTCTDLEKDLVMHFAISNCFELGENLKRRTWENFPSQVPMSIETDPGEMAEMEWENFEEFWKYIIKWNKRQRRGDITSEKLSRVFDAWRDKHPV